MNNPHASAIGRFAAFLSSIFKLLSPGCSAASSAISHPQSAIGRAAASTPHPSNTSPRGIQPFYSTEVRPQPSAIGHRPQSGLRFSFSAFFFALFLAFTSTGWGQAPIAQFDFPASDSLVVSSKDSNLTVSNVSLSTGTISTNMTAGSYFPNKPYIDEGAGWTATTQAAAKNFTFTITAAAGYTFSITNISFRAYATSAGPSAFGFAIAGTDVYSVNAPNSSIVAVNEAVSGQSGLTSATIKIQGWLNGSRSSSGGGSFRLDDIIVTGTVTEDTPPASPPVVTASTFNGTVGTAFNQSISATNSPTAYGLQSGTLPVGLSLDTSTGAISGTPTTAGNGTTVTMNATNASGTGNATITFNIAKGNQTITFPAQSSLGIGSTRALDATTNSGLTITYTSSNTSVATLSGTDVTGVAAGTTTLNATQAGDADWNAATLVGQSLTVAELPLLSENMGTPSGTTAIASNNFQNNSTLTFSGDADVRTSTASSGYTGASGDGNVFITNSLNRTFEISGINTYGYTDLALSFGQHKSSIDANNELAVEVSSDGTNYTGLTYSRATGSGTANWILIEPTGSIPAVSNLRIRFRNTSTLSQWRIDDVVLTGTKTPTIAAAGTPAALTTTYGTASSTTSFTVNGTFMSAGITITPPAGFEVSTQSNFSSNTGNNSTPLTVGSPGSIANTTVYLRLAATASAGSPSGNIVLSSSGATSVNVATTASTVNQKAVTITGLSAANKPYDATTTVSVTGTPAYSGLENGESTAVTGSVSWAFPNANVENGKSLTRTGSYNAPSANYSLTQPTLAANITARDLTITANATSKVFGNLLTGGAGSTAFTSSGLQGSDSLASVTITYGSGAASDAGAGAYAGSITPSAAVFGSGSASNYSISFVAGTLTVTQATQSITFGALSAVTYGDSAFGLAATATSSLSVSYTSSNTSVATISGSTLTIVAAGSTTITASQSGNANFSAAANVTQSLTVNPKTLTGSFTANNKTFDGTTSATVATRAVDGKVGDDDVNHTGGTATFDTAAVGNGKTVTLAGATLTGSKAANYSLSSVSTTTANITQATPSITTPPTASTITSGQALSDSILSGGAASVAGAFAFTDPGTVPSPGIDSQGVTFTPTDSGNYTTQTTSVDVGVLRAAPVPTRASAPTGTGFTVNWASSPGAGNYTVLHSTNKNMSAATSVDTDSTSLTLSVGAGLRFVQVRANNAAGASANSTMQVNQLQSIPAGATVYASIPGVVPGGTSTIAEKFGAANEAGLAAGGTPSTSTNIIRLNSGGSSQAGVYFLSGNWVRGDAIVNDEAIPAGQAFILRNNSASTDYILLAGTPAGGGRPAVSLSDGTGSFTLLTPARTQPTALDALDLRSTGAADSATRIKEAINANTSDLIIIPQAGRLRGYFHDGTDWRSAGGNVVSDPTAITVPAGGAFFIRKAPGSNFDSWTPPAEE